MPSTVASVFAAAELVTQEVVRWGRRIPSDRPGVYAVALTEGSQDSRPTLPTAPIDSAAVDLLLDRRPELRLDGGRPTPEVLAERVASFWLPDQVIVYLGLAGTSLAGRLAQYYKTPLGARGPHAGGWFLKLLRNLSELHVHWSECEDPDEADTRMVASFAARVSDKAAESLHDSINRLPFANLRWPRGGRKNHGITGATAPRTPRGPARTPAAPESRPRRPTSSARIDPETISRFVQDELRRRGMDQVGAVEAARWLDDTGILKDSQHRPGLPLRNLLRRQLIRGQRQEANGRWYIHRSK